MCMALAAGNAMDIADNGTIVGFDSSQTQRIAWIQPDGEGDIIGASSIATNVFELSEGEWRLVLHHSSSFLEDDLDDDEDPLDLDPERPPQGGSGMDGVN